MLLKEWVYTRTAWRSQLLAFLIPLAVVLSIIGSPLKGEAQRDALYAGLVAVMVYAGLLRPIQRIGSDFGLGPGAWVLKAGVPSARVIASKTAFSFLPAAISLVPVAVLTARALSLDMQRTLLTVLICLACCVTLTQLLATLLADRYLMMGIGAFVAAPSFLAPSNIGGQEQLLTLGAGVPLLSAMIVPSAVAAGALPPLWTVLSLLVVACLLSWLTAHLWEQRLLRHLA